MLKLSLSLSLSLSLAYGSDTHFSALVSVWRWCNVICVPGRRCAPITTTSGLLTVVS